MNEKEGRVGDAAREAEWRQQERARDLERGGAASAGDTARVQRYRLVVRSLDRAPDHALPSNFAHAASVEISRQLARRQQQDRAFARRLRGGLLVVYLVVLFAAALVFSPAWQPALVGLMTPEALLNPWLLAGAACIAASWLLGRLRSGARR